MIWPGACRRGNETICRSETELAPHDDPQKDWADAGAPPARDAVITNIEKAVADRGIFIADPLVAIDIRMAGIRCLQSEL
jgi:hypothetical protein